MKVVLYLEYSSPSMCFMNYIFFPLFVGKSLFIRVNFQVGLSQTRMVTSCMLDNTSKSKIKLTFLNHDNMKLILVYVYYEVCFIFIEDKSLFITTDFQTKIPYRVIKCNIESISSKRISTIQNWVVKMIR